MRSMPGRVDNNAIWKSPTAATRSRQPEQKPEARGSHHIEPQDILRILFVGIAATAVWFRIWEPIPRVSIIAIIATLVHVSSECAFILNSARLISVASLRK